MQCYSTINVENDEDWSLIKKARKTIPNILLDRGFFGFICPAIFLKFYLSWAVLVLLVLLYSWHFACPGLFRFHLSCYIPDILLVLGCSGSICPAIFLTFCLSWNFPVLSVLLYSWHFVCLGLFRFHLSCYIPEIFLVLGFSGCSCTALFPYIS